MAVVCAQRIEVSTRETRAVQWHRPKQPAIREDRSRAGLGVGKVHSSKEASNDRGAKGPKFKGNAGRSQNAEIDMSLRRYSTKSKCGLWSAPNWSVSNNCSMSITIWEASKRWANASTTWPPMPKVSGWPCAGSLNEPFALRASTGRSLVRIASTASGWNVSCRVGYLPPTGSRCPFHGTPELIPTDHVTWRMVVDYRRSSIPAAGRAEDFGELSRAVHLGLGITPGRDRARPHRSRDVPKASSLAGVMQTETVCLQLSCEHPFDHLQKLLLTVNPEFILNSNTKQYSSRFGNCADIGCVAFFCLLLARIEELWVVSRRVAEAES